MEEVYIVKDTATGKKIGKGFIKKEHAKVERDRLQKLTKEGMPEHAERHDQTKWSFQVSNGPDHPNNKVH